MGFIIEIEEKDVFPHSTAKAENYTLRRGVNSILQNQNDEIALLYAKNDDSFFLPGGKTEDGEDMITALTREIREEVGCDISDPEHIGVSILYEEKIRNVTIYNCFHALVNGSLGSVNLTEREKADGVELKWLSIGAALAALSHATSDDYIDRFIIARDQAILREYSRQI